MYSGAITSYIDVAQVAIYAFWIFFALLIFYLRREDKREGYPLESDRSGAITVQGFPKIPSPKVFKLPHGGTVSAPKQEDPQRSIAAEPVGNWPGAPLEPTGNPLVDGVGPAAYALRQDFPDLTHDGEPRIVPMRVATDFYVEPRDPDPRGMQVLCADNKVAGTVEEIWVDRAEHGVRYLEVAVGDDANAQRKLLPMPFARVDSFRKRVRVKSIFAKHFADVPNIRNSDIVTKLEEDRITAYFAGGHLYAEPSRAEPIL